MPWEEAWLDQARPASRTLWRGVEAQHQVATMRLVDDLDEQQLLEQLLEDSKPALPQGARGSHYLVFTPFRYASPQASRFRRANEPGIWYGADEPATVAAEVAYWRWRFLMDSDGLRGQQAIAELTFFQARFSGDELDITVAPWSRHRGDWRADDYRRCQALAARVRAREPAIDAIRYESARREGAACLAVFDPRVLAITEPGLQQTWVCKTTRDVVLMTHDRDRLQFRWT